MKKLFQCINTGLATAVLVGLTACEEPQITVNTVPKPQEKTATMTPMPGMQEESETLGTPEWEAPEHWVAQSGSAMRKGSWHIDGDNDTHADMSVIPFPGDVGGDLANINRWIGQINASPIIEADLPAMREEGALTVDSHAGFTVYLEGDTQNIYGAIIPVGEHTWFFKMMGDKELVASERPTVDTFLQTVRFP